MKIKVTMKYPDTMSEAVYEAVRDYVSELKLGDFDAEVLIESICIRERVKLNTWFEYSEYLTVTFDTDDMTAIVEKLR